MLVLWGQGIFGPDHLRAMHGRETLRFVLRSWGEAGVRLEPGAADTRRQFNLDGWARGNDRPVT